VQQELGASAAGVSGCDTWVPQALASKGGAAPSQEEVCLLLQAVSENICKEAEWMVSGRGGRSEVQGLASSESKSK
jgi:hypothetical protein